MIALVSAATEVKQSNTVLLAAMIAACGAVFGPLALVFYTRVLSQRDTRRAEDLRRKERLEDFERTEAVRKMAEEAAVLLKAQNKAVLESKREMIEKLEVVRGLVNSNLTTEMEAHLLALRELIDLKDQQGIKVEGSARVALRELQLTVAERRSDHATVEAMARAELQK